jgi:hypothetical protein
MYSNITSPLPLFSERDHVKKKAANQKSSEAESFKNMKRNI